VCSAFIVVEGKTNSVPLSISGFLRVTASLCSLTASHLYW
jgi:hypothetical protein